MYLRVSLTEQCNLRCTYCLPADARPVPAAATAGELDRLMAAVCAAVPVGKIRLTGGEPTLCPELLQHVRAAAWLAPEVGMTSNGVRLAPLLPALREAGLRRLNLSLDAPDAAGFRRMARRDGFAAVLAALRAALRLGFAPLKLNAVATAGSDAAGLVRLAVAEGVHLRFIELMEVGEGGRGWAGRHLPAARLRERLAREGIALEPDPRRDGPTCRVWTLRGVDPARTTVGFIASASEPFCGACDRLRLTCHGRLHTCLFGGGIDLLAPLRDGGPQRVVELVRTAAAGKAPPPRFRRQAAMAAIGG